MNEGVHVQSNEQKRAAHTTSAGKIVLRVTELETRSFLEIRKVTRIFRPNVGDFVSPKTNGGVAIQAEL